ncbi:hypothetical protein B296_00017087 [Ensete ventricosum]|uniref:Uncharacterized protein n=1 Tax=Ensete ventricosum TaxID=4639 RepID=A0A426YV49_ENSVE|nr:hypothetical protein B296_00017087 [Ensete ventricosum]
MSISSNTLFTLLSMTPVSKCCRVLAQPLGGPLVGTVPASVTSMCDPSHDGPRSSLSIGPGFKRCSGISPKFASRFAEGIGKLARNTPGDRRKKTKRLTARMSEAAGLVGVELNWLTKGLVNIMFKPKFEKWREPLLWKF